MPENYKEIVRRVVEEGWNKGKVEVLDQLCQKDYKGHDPLFGTLDLEGFKRAITEYRTAFADLNVKILQVFNEGELVAIRWQSEGRHSGSFMGTPASGKNVRIEGVHVARIRDGKVVEDWAQFDALGLLQQIGIVPKLDASKARTTREQPRVS